MIVVTSTVNSAFVMTVVSSVPDMFLNSITKDHSSTVEPAAPNAQTYQLTDEQTAFLPERQTACTVFPRISAQGAYFKFGF